MLESHQERAGGRGRQAGRAGTYLRDQQGYDYLSMVTSVDWPQYFEVVYYLYGVGHSPRMATASLKVRLPDKANPVVPSLIAIWPGADLQERRSLRHDGHPLRGPPEPAAHPAVGRLRGLAAAQGLRESYYEEETKPFKSRHPDGKHLWAEDRVPWKDNVTYPVGLGPRPVDPAQVQYRRIMEVDESAGRQRATASATSRPSGSWSTWGRSTPAPTACSAWCSPSKARTWSGWSRRSAICTAATRRSASATPTS